ncbi:MAG: 50S ribosomal protein L16 [Nanoarchaeota archaeon]|nr:50S ribosomal protein L16 [Nanoarchaeota archaeon]MBU0963148.1 50S ribosomal protein L16 [Nanoarchaeota archaeon]
MSTLRKGCCYRHLTRPYTRKSKFKKFSYISTIPESKIVKFNSGDIKKQFAYKIFLVSNEDLNIRHNALESARQVVNRDLDLAISGSYFFRIRAIPHHILRENKMLTGAHADRLQTGMAHSFGKPAGRAARVHKGNKIAEAHVDESGIETVKKAYRKAISKLPGKYSIKIEKI